MSMAASDIGLSRVTCPFLPGDLLPLLEPPRELSGGRNTGSIGRGQSRGIADSVFFAGGRPRGRGAGSSIGPTLSISSCWFFGGRPRPKRRPTSSTFSFVGVPVSGLLAGERGIVVEALRFLE